MISTKEELVNGIIYLYSQNIPITTAGLIPHSEVYNAIIRRTTSGAKLFETMRDLREAAALKLEELNQNEDAQKMRAYNKNLCSQRLLSSTQIAKRKMEFIAQARERYTHKLPINLTYYLHNNRKKLAKIIRAFGTFPQFLEEAEIPHNEVYLNIKLPLEAHICILYDLYLQGITPSRPMAILYIPRTVAKFEKNFERSYYKAMSYIEKLLLEDNKPTDALAFSPKTLVKHPHAYYPRKQVVSQPLTLEHINENTLRNPELTRKTSPQSEVSVPIQNNESSRQLSDTYMLFRKWRAKNI